MIRMMLFKTDGDDLILLPTVVMASMMVPVVQKRPMRMVSITVWW